MIVIDVGAARHGDEYSIERLIDEFHPEHLYAFDPLIEISDIPNTLAEGRVELIRQAAWTHDGTIGFRRNGSRSRVELLASDVDCIDIATFIENLPGEGHVLKTDAEGAEYPLLAHLIATGMDKRLSLAWVEWHRDLDPRGTLEQTIRRDISCDLRDWHW